MLQFRALAQRIWPQGPVEEQQFSTSIEDFNGLIAASVLTGCPQAPHETAPDNPIALIWSDRAGGCGGEDERGGPGTSDKAELN